MPRSTAKYAPMHPTISVDESIPQPSLIAGAPKGMHAAVPFPLLSLAEQSPEFPQVTGHRNEGIFPRFVFQGHPTLVSGVAKDLHQARVIRGFNRLVAPAHLDLYLHID